MSLWSTIALEVGGVFGEVETTANPTSIRIPSESYLLFFGQVWFLLVALIGATSI